MERKMFDTPVLPRLETILAEVKSGDIAVPKFQRPFVWDDDRRLNLLDSIVNGMPIGSLLVWRTNRRDLNTYEEVGGVKLQRPLLGGERINYLLDGHQRISTLFGALYWGAREPSTDDDDTRWPLFYELGATDRPAFRVLPRRRVAPENWLRLDLLLDGDKLFEVTRRLRESGRRDLAREAENLANIFRDYIIPIVPLVTEELDVVTDAFVRINSQGKGMTEAHMLRALTHLKADDTDRYFSDVRRRLEPLGWGALDDQVLVNVLKAQLGLDVYASSVRGVHEMLEKDPAPLERLADIVEEAVEILAEIGVGGLSALPYAYQLVTLAALVAKYPRSLGKSRVNGQLRTWFWITTYTEQFSGMTGSGIRNGIDALVAAVKKDDTLKIPEVAPVRPLQEIRMSTVRARAFLLFLAQLPRDARARVRRQELLGSGDIQAVPSLLSTGPGVKPGNRVIANPAELRMLRGTLKKGQLLMPDIADEFGIPEEALKALPDQEAFVEARGIWLAAQEKLFIESFGLTVSDAK